MTALCDLLLALPAAGEHVRARPVPGRAARLYDLLHDCGPLTIDELCERTGWSRANVRYTLGSLRRFRRLSATYACGVWRYQLAPQAERPR